MIDLFLFFYILLIILKTKDFKPAFRSLNIPTQSKIIENVENIAISERTMRSKVLSINKKALLFRISIIFKLSINKQGFHELPKKFEKKHFSLVNLTTSSKIIGFRQKLIVDPNSGLKATLGNTLVEGF